MSILLVTFLQSPTGTFHKSFSPQSPVNSALGHLTFLNPKLSYKKALLRRAICGARWRAEFGQKCHLCQGSNSHTSIGDRGTHACLYGKTWSEHLVMCQRDTEGAHNLPTLWPLAQMRTIKNRPWDNEPGWHTCSWRSTAKDVSRPPLLPHLIMANDWWELVITDGRREARAYGIWADTDITVVVEGQGGAHQNTVGGWFTLRASWCHLIFLFQLADGCRDAGMDGWKDAGIIVIFLYVCYDLYVLQ